MEPVFSCNDSLAGLAGAANFSDRLTIMHAELRRRCPGIERMAVALHDPLSGLLKTFAASPAVESPLCNYQADFAQVTSLRETMTHGQPRVVDNLEIYAASRSEHTRRILGHGFASSYTLPIFDQQVLVGFVFLNSMHKRYFHGWVVEQAGVFAHLAARELINEIGKLRTLNAALRTTISMVHTRDPETGNHLERMARYSRLIARELIANGKSSFNDEQVEQLFTFSPLHDVGKIGIPDRILLKPDKLSADERAVMNTHPLVGRQMIDRLIANFALEGIPHLDILLQLVEYHHETIDGNGYPYGLQGDEIPLVARIVAVSDIFDALTTARPYKEPWHNQPAFAMLQLLAIDKLDPDCVQAMLNRADEVRTIQAHFADLPAAA
jgi:HD-GYP domain-containing protein (c-di-GMP phosphodiesterase class II)